MADVKISALPSATTPLAGTEVLPVVQGGATRKVSVADLTAARTVAASTVNVDANTADPAVRITQTGAGNALLVEDSASDTTPFAITSDGFVVRGNATALTGVNYLGSAGTLSIQQHGTGANISAIWSANWSTAANGGPSVALSKSKSGVINTHTLVADGDDLGAISFAGSDGTSFINAATILVEVDGTPGAGDMPGRLVFSTTAAGASTPTSRMQITNAGNIVAGGSVALATNATDGFLYVPTCAGTPTGTPTAITGMAPIVVNTTNNKLYFYSGGAWRDAGP